MCRIKCTVYLKINKNKHKRNVDKIFIILSVVCMCSFNSYSILYITIFDSIKKAMMQIGKLVN